MDFIIKTLKTLFENENVDEKYIKDFMELKVLDIDKINFINTYGSKATKQKLIRFVLQR